MKSMVRSILVAGLVCVFAGCATVPPPEVEAITLDIPAYLEETLNVSYRPARELQFGNMSCLVDPKLIPSKSPLDVAFPCNEFRSSGVSVTVGWGRKGLVLGELEAMVSRNIRMRSRLGPPEDSAKDLRECSEVAAETLKDKGVLRRCRVEFFTTQSKYKRATFTVFYLKPQEDRDYQPIVITEGIFGRGDDEAQRDAFLYGEALDWIKK